MLRSGAGKRNVAVPSGGALLRLADPPPRPGRLLGALLGGVPVGELGTELVGVPAELSPLLVRRAARAQLAENPVGRLEQVPVGPDHPLRVGRRVIPRGDG